MRFDSTELCSSCRTSSVRGDQLTLVIWDRASCTGWGISVCLRHAAGLVERAHAGGAIDQDGQPADMGCAAAPKRLQCGQNEQQQQENLEDQQQIAFEFLERRIDPLPTQRRAKEENEFRTS